MSKKDFEACPKCGSNTGVVPKLLLIGLESPYKKFPKEIPGGYQRFDQLAVDECRDYTLLNKPLEQFIEGYYCSSCDLGFVPDSKVTPGVLVMRAVQTGQNNRSAMEASVRPEGGVLCPFCGLIFQITDSHRWDGERHMTCHQRITLVGER